MSTIIENPLRRLAEMVADIPEREMKFITHPNYAFERAAYSFWQNHQHLAWHSYFNLQNIESVKQHFYTCGKLDVLRVSRYNVPLFGYGRTHISYAALSDNKNLVREFAALNYKTEFQIRGKKKVVYFKELSENGDPEIYCDTMIKAMVMDDEGLKKNILLYEQKTSLVKKNKGMEIDFDFFRGILKKDKDMVFKAIEELTTPRVHKARNIHDILYNQLVSEPAIGFAKIAWINGLEIEPTSKFIPKELLPIKPNQVYEDDYLRYDK